MDNNSLGKWAAIDIETTGVNPSDDSIIDIGFLQFEGTKFIRRFSSMVRFEGKLSKFIEALTGIKSSQLKKAPTWDNVEPELVDLDGHVLLAHNARFEKSFLEPFFEKHYQQKDFRIEEREQYADSLYLLALLYPHRSNLNLESFILDFGIKEKEDHRGLEDATDMLKVILIALHQLNLDVERKLFLMSLVEKFQLHKDFWIFKWVFLSSNELIELATQFDFDLIQHLSKIKSNTSNLSNKKIKPHFEQTFSGENISNILKDENQIRQVLPNYRHRQSQEQMALRCGQSFKNNIHSLIQAPTGTGKTVGYLLPAVLFSKETKQKVLVSTGTKTLQNQALNKDIPDIKKMLGLEDKQVQFSLLLGSNNHFCELLFRRDESEVDMFNQDKKSELKLAKAFLEVVFFHNSKNSYDQQIHRENFPYVVKNIFEGFSDIEEEIKVDFRACSGSKCPYVKGCSYIAGLRAAKDADIIVGNHALMFTWPKAFPRPAHIIVDEAHKIENEATRVFTMEVTSQNLRILEKNLRHSQSLGSLYYLISQTLESKDQVTETIQKIKKQADWLVEIIETQLQHLETLFERYFKKMPRYTSLYWNELPMVQNKQADELGQAIYNHLEGIFHGLKNLQVELAPYLNFWQLPQLEDPNMIVAYTRMEAFLQSIDELVLAYNTCLNGSEDFTASMKFHEQNGFQLSASPINIGKKVFEGLLQTSSSVVFTSATLGNAHGDVGVAGVEWVTGYMYLDPAKRFKQGFYLPAIYDYKNKSKVFLCDDMPNIYDSSFVQKTMDEVIPIIREIGGRSLLLFSAKNRFEQAREYLLAKLEGEFPLFIQGMGRDIVEEFKKVSNGVLLGMESFGEGIDIPGDALQFVFIDKIPDLKPEILLDKRREFFDRNFGNEFTDYFLAHRARSLHQKLGRLLRTENDRGGVIVVDTRVKSWKGRTLDQFFKLMEPYNIKRTSMSEAKQGILDYLSSNNIH